MYAVMPLTVLVVLSVVVTCGGETQTTNQAPSTVTSTAASPPTTVQPLTEDKMTSTTPIPQTNTTVSLASSSLQTSNSTEESNIGTPPLTTNYQAESDSGKTTLQAAASASASASASISPSQSASPSASQSASTLPNDRIPSDPGASVVIPEMGKENLAANPGLVAVICIFCIILVLTLAVTIVKCVYLPRPNFERLEDVQLGNVNEESPFAHYSK